MAGEIFIIPLPLKVKINKKEDYFYINLNTYRNAHYHTLNKAKVIFEEQIAHKLKNIPKIKKCKITYSLFTGSQRLSDVSNMCCIVDKFFCDALVNKGILEDDNLTIIPETKYLFEYVDKENPHIDAIIHSIVFEKKEEPVKVTLVEAEIQEALIAYVREKMPQMVSTDIKIDLKAGRGAEGYTAELDFVINDSLVKKETKIEVFNEDKEDPEEVSGEADDDSATIGAEPTIAVTQQAPVEAEKAPQVAQGAPTSLSAPKSLFANLTKPVHDVKTE